MTFLLFGICLKGYIRYSVDSEELIAKENDIFIIGERHVIDNYTFSSDFKGFALLISHNFINDIIMGINSVSSLYVFFSTHPVVSLGLKEFSAIESDFIFLEKKLSRGDCYFQKNSVRSLLLLIVYDLSNILFCSKQINITTKHTCSETIFMNFICLVEKKCKYERCVSWYGSQLNITSNYLSGVVKKTSKFTANEWISRFVMLEAQTLIKNSSKSIKEIAIDLNFPNQSFFGKYFKDHRGISPLEYRKC